MLDDLFEPLQVDLTSRQVRQSRIASDGLSLGVPMPMLEGETSPGGSVLVRFAQRGHRLFVAEDARLTDRIVEQLHHAVVFDRALQHGRAEERAGIAPDLHDDIGARLLTLMYTARSTEVEDRVRHPCKI